MLLQRTSALPFRVCVQSDSKSPTCPASLELWKRYRRDQDNELHSLLYGVLYKCTTENTAAKKNREETTFCVKAELPWKFWRFPGIRSRTPDSNEDNNWRSKADPAVVSMIIVSHCPESIHPAPSNFLRGWPFGPLRQNLLRRQHWLFELMCEVSSKRMFSWKQLIPQKRKANKRSEIWKQQ